MRLDVRLPLGLMFFLIGIILTCYGLFGGGSAGPRPDAGNINLRSGLALLFFGGACLLLAWRARRKARSSRSN